MGLNLGAMIKMATQIKDEDSLCKFLGENVLIDGVETFVIFRDEKTKKVDVRKFKVDLIEILRGYEQKISDQKSLIEKITKNIGHGE